MPQPPKSESKRRHVTTACISCRESKIKCDGVTPLCSNCKNKSRECRYQAGEDKRKLSLRVAVELLSSRVDQLCHFINQHGLQTPPMPPDENKSLTRILDTLGLSKANNPLEQNPTPPIDPALTLGTQPFAPPGQLPPEFSLPLDVTSFGLADHRHDENAQVWNVAREVAVPRGIADWDWSPPETIESAGGVDIASVRAPSHPLLSSYSEAALSDLDNDGDDDDDDGDDGASGTTEDDLVNQLSDRLGTLHIGSNGRISYFGPTSNFSLVEMPAGSETLAVDRTVRNDGQEHLDSMGYGKTIPPDFEDHLINLYFAWQNPSSPIVDRALYEEAKFKWLEREEDTPYYSEALRNAMCSLGAAFETRYHPRFVTFPKSLPDFFAARAKTLLEIELESPSVSTVQAMVVLSSHEIGANRDSRGWLYSGMAIRLAFDLALHKDMTPYVAKGNLTQAEAELRRTVFWATYVVDQSLGYYRGRPFRVSLDDITVHKPTGSRTDGAKWFPYTSPTTNGSPSEAFVEDVNLHRIELCEIMAPLGHTLYGNSKIPKNILQENNEKIVSRLFVWKERLPAFLQVDPDDTEGTYLPHVLLLHMQYYQNVIHSHRPWMSSSYIQPQPPQGPGYMHAQRMCIESAAAVAKLVRAYERLYSLRRVSTQGVAVVFSAAVILIFASMSRRHRRRRRRSSSSRRAAETATHLGVCFRALEELSSSWECAKRARDFLVILQRTWELRSRRLGQGAAAGGAGGGGGGGAGVEGAGGARKVATGMIVPGRGFARPGDQGSSRKRARTDSPAGTSKSMSSFQSISPVQPVDGQRDDHEGIDMDMRLDLDWVFTTGGQAIPGSWDSLLPPDALYFHHNGAG